MSEILFLCHRIPWPPDRGDKIRSFHILRALSVMAPVHLACFADGHEERQSADEAGLNLASFVIADKPKPMWWNGIRGLSSNKPVSLTAFESGDIHDFVKRTLAEQDISCIFVFSGQMAQYIPDEFSGRIVMDFVDVDSAKFESYAANSSGPMQWIHRREGRLLAEFEKTIAHRVDHALFVSDAEAALFRDRSGIASSKIKAMGNGIDLDFYNPADVVSAECEPGCPIILFTGQMDYPPNVEAVSSFCRQVMPQIRQSHPLAEFVVAGRTPTKEVRDLDGLNGTRVLGEVDDIRTWLKAADLVVAPLRIARGIQNKVLEAMAMGKAVVASTAAANGIEAENGKHFLVAGSPEEEAAAAIRLLSDPELSQKLGSQAADMIRQNYRWTDQLSRLPEYCGLEETLAMEAAE
ncbi:MAG: TIGR03087 family PEP-CTERM/XrtA system glycosyltransferase [Pseudomonadota bacterium]